MMQPQIVQGTVVQGTVVDMSQPAVVVSQPVVESSKAVAYAVPGIETAVPVGEYPPLVEMVRRFEADLGVTGTMSDVIQSTCRELSVDRTGLSLVQQAERAYDVMYHRGARATTAPPPRGAAPASSAAPLLLDDDPYAPRADGLLSTGDLSGDYCCCCFLPPFGYGWSKVVPHGPDAIEQWGWCCCTQAGPFCLGGEYRTRIAGTNSFRHFKDPNNVTTFHPTGASNGASMLCKLNAKKYRFRKVSTAEIAGTWCCVCVGLFMGGFGTSCHGVQPNGEDNLSYNGCLCWNGLPLPYIEERTRVYFEGRPTNIFVKTDDPNNMTSYNASNVSCAGNGCTYYCKC